MRRLQRHGYLKEERTRGAMESVPRHLFVPENLLSSAYVDSPLPIGGGQTISAPHMVAIMAEAADLKGGQRILEVGAGSGYHAAVMAELVRPEGEVITIERIPSLAERARLNLSAAGYSGMVEVVVADGSLGFPEKAPFDRIVVTCGAPEIPEPLKEQLVDGGKLIVPVGSMGYQELMRLTQNGDEISVENLGGCVFVPLVGEHGFHLR